MVRKLGNVILQIVAGGNVATILMMLAVGYSDRINPVEHPVLSTVGLAFPLFLCLNIAFLIFWLVFKVRWVFIPVLGFIVCYGPIRIYTPLNVSRSVPEGAIKVLSYNVWMFKEWDDPDMPSETVDYLLGQDADIVCLLEAGVDYRRRVRLDSLMGKAYKYCDTSCVAPNKDVTAIYSKYPIVGKEPIHYQSESNHSSAFRINIAGDTVIFIANHMESIMLTSEDKHNFKSMVSGNMKTDTARAESRRLISKLAHASAIRAPQAEAVAKYVDGHSGESIILCGDFNDSPISYVRRTMAGNLTDCYVESGNGPGISYHVSGFYVRIDNMMCSADWTPYGCKVDNSVKASDHYPIICWLKKNTAPGK